MKIVTNYKLQVTSFLFLVILLFPVFVFAQADQSIWSKGIVQCGGKGQPLCNVCDVFKLVDNIIRLLWSGAALIGTVAFMYGGFLYWRGKPAEAKKVLTNVVIGIAIAFLAWIGIDTIIKLLVTQKFTGDAANLPTSVQGGVVKYGPWNQINCQAVTQTGQDGESGLAGPGKNIGDFITEPPRVSYEEGTYTDAEARALLKGKVQVNLQNCNIGQKTGCTSLDGIRRAAVHAALDIQRDCRCEVIISGGTEGGHSVGEFSHASGYKIDFRANKSTDPESGFDPLSSWILINYDVKLPKRSDGATMRTNSLACLIFADERNKSGITPHWDLLVKEPPKGEFKCR